MNYVERFTFLVTRDGGSRITTAVMDGNGHSWDCCTIDSHDFPNVESAAALEAILNEVLVLRSRGSFEVKGDANNLLIIVHYNHGHLRIAIQLGFALQEAEDNPRVRWLAKESDLQSQALTMAGLLLPAKHYGATSLRLAPSAYREGITYATHGYLAGIAEHCPNLTALDVDCISGNKLALSSLARLTSLKSLTLRTTEREVSELDRLTGLTTLRLSGTNFDASWVSALTGLTELRIHCCTDNSALLWLAKLTRLTTLALAMCYGYNLKSTATLRGLTCLKALYLDDNGRATQEELVEQMGITIIADPWKWE